MRNAFFARINRMMGQVARKAATLAIVGTVSACTTHQWEGDATGQRPDDTSAPDDTGAPQGCTVTLYRDEDGDTFGNPALSLLVDCSLAGQLDGYTSDGTDCDDRNPDRNPGEPEIVCDGVDNDCDPETDDGPEEGARSANECGGEDTDGDGYYTQDGDGNVIDCDDGDADVNPAAEETCNSGTDDDCDGLADADDDSVTDAITVYPDADGDGFGDESDAGTAVCELAAGEVEDHSDCDDDPATGVDVHPGAAEVENDNVDQDCDGEDLVTVPEADADSDGDPDATDCDDADPAIHTGATEIPDNTVDEDCDGIALGDVDCDGVAESAGDCDDSDPTAHPGATEVCGNAVDEDCDGTADACPSEPDADSDGDPDASDCDDSDPLVFTGAAETCDEQDNDCDGSTDEGTLTSWYTDADGDGYGEEGDSAEEACTAPAGKVDNDDDCDDGDDEINPGEAELPDNGVDENCDDTDDSVIDSLACAADEFSCTADQDGDGADDAVLLRDDNWTYSEVFGNDATVYRHSGTCGIVDQVVESNAQGFYVLSVADLGTCTALFTLYQSNADTDGDGVGDEDVWWQNGSCASSPDDFGGLCEWMGGTNYGLRIDPVSGEL